MPKPAEIVHAITGRYERAMRVALIKVFKAQRIGLPYDEIRTVGGAPAMLIEKWEKEFSEWFMSFRDVWEKMWKKSIGVKFATQELFDDWVMSRSFVIGTELASVNAAATSTALYIYADSSWTRLQRELRNTIGMLPRQVSAFARQSAAIREKYPPARAEAMIKRLHRKKIAYRAQLIARNELSTGVNKAKYDVMQNRIASGQLPEAMEKRWSTIGDDRVSDGCEENEALTWKPMDYEYQGGGTPVIIPPRFPGCRCGLQYRRAKVAA